MSNKSFYISVSFLLGIAGSCGAMEQAVDLDQAIDLHQAIQNKVADHDMTSCYYTSPFIAVHTFNAMHQCEQQGDNGFGKIESMSIYHTRMLGTISPGLAKVLSMPGAPSVILGQEFSLSAPNLMSTILATMNGCLNGRTVGYNASSNLTGSRDQCLVTFWLVEEFDKLLAPTTFVSAFTNKRGPIKTTLYLDRMQYTYLKSRQTTEKFAIINAHFLYQSPQLCRNDSLYIKELAGLIQQDSMVLSGLGFRLIFGGDVNLSPSILQGYLVNNFFAITAGIIGSSLSFNVSSQTGTPQENDLIAVYTPTSSGESTPTPITSTNSFVGGTPSDIPGLLRGSNMSNLAEPISQSPLSSSYSSNASFSEASQFLSRISPQIHDRVKDVYDAGQFSIECLQVLASFPMQEHATIYNDLFELTMLHGNNKVRLSEELNQFLTLTNGAVTNDYYGLASSMPATPPTSSSPQMLSYAWGYSTFPQGQPALTPTPPMSSSPQMLSYASGYSTFPQGQPAPIESWGRFSSSEQCIRVGILISIQREVRTALANGRITRNQILELSSRDFSQQKAFWEMMNRGY